MLYSIEQQLSRINWAPCLRTIRNVHTHTCSTQPHASDLPAPATCRSMQQQTWKPWTSASAITVSSTLSLASSSKQHQHCRPLKTCPQILWMSLMVKPTKAYVGRIPPLPVLCCCFLASLLPLWQMWWTCFLMRWTLRWWQSHLTLCMIPTPSVSSSHTGYNTTMTAHTTTSTPLKAWTSMQQHSKANCRKDLKVGVENICVCHAMARCQSRHRLTMCTSG